MKKIIFACLLFFIGACFINASHAQISFSIKVVPPEPFYERPEQPSVNHVWIEGEWAWRNNNYVWQPGYWTVPERDHVWERGEWVRNADGTSYWRQGYWRQIPHVGVRAYLPEPNYLRPPAPSPRHIWVNGEWVWQNNNYIYQTGYWTIPERDHIWMKGHWAQWPNGEWYWVKGYWRRIPEEVFVRSVPPEPVVARPPAPSANHEWIEGEWVWRNNTYTWQTGYWRLHDPHKVWVRGYWHQRANGGWFWIGGHWNLV